MAELTSHRIQTVGAFIKLFNCSGFERPEIESTYDQCTNIAGALFTSQTPKKAAMAMASGLIGTVLKINRQAREKQS